MSPLHSVGLRWKLLSHGRTDIPRECSAHGAVVLSQTIHTVPPWIFEALENDYGGGFSDIVFAITRLATGAEISWAFP